MFGDTTLNCWSISDREPGSWGMKWTVGSFADEQWLQFGLWGIGASFPRKYNWCHLPRICCDISGTLLMLKAMHASQNAFQPQNFRKDDKSKSCGSAHKLTNIMHIFKTSTTQTLSPSDWQYIWVSQTHIQSFTHQDVDFKTKICFIKVALGAKKALSSNLQWKKKQKTKLADKKNRKMAQKAKNKGKNKVAEIPDHLK